jgi:hypothetical protein
MRRADGLALIPPASSAGCLFCVLTALMRKLNYEVGVEGLSAHDLRSS